MNYNHGYSGSGSYQQQQVMPYNDYGHGTEQGQGGHGQGQGGHPAYNNNYPPQQQQQYSLDYGHGHGQGGQGQGYSDPQQQQPSQYYQDYSGQQQEQDPYVRRDPQGPHPPQQQYTTMGGHGHTHTQGQQQPTYGVNPEGRVLRDPQRMQGLGVGSAGDHGGQKGDDMSMTYDPLRPTYNATPSPYPPVSYQHQQQKAPIVAPNIDSIFEIAAERQIQKQQQQQHGLSLSEALSAAQNPISRSIQPPAIPAYQIPAPVKEHPMAIVPRTTPPAPAPAPATKGSNVEVITGLVTQIQDSFGMVSGEIFFQTSTVVGGILPRVGDKVVVEAEKVSGMPFKFNGLRVLILSKDLTHDNGDQNSTATLIRGGSSMGMTIPPPKTTPPLRSILKRNPPPPPVLSGGNKRKEEVITSGDGDVGGARGHGPNHGHSAYTFLLDDRKDFPIPIFPQGKKFEEGLGDLYPELSYVKDEPKKTRSRSREKSRDKKRKGRSRSRSSRSRSKESRRRRRSRSRSRSKSRSRRRRSRSRSRSKSRSRRNRRSRSRDRSSRRSRSRSKSSSVSIISSNPFGADSEIIAVIEPSTLFPKRVVRKRSEEPPAPMHTPFMEPTRQQLATPSANTRPIQRPINEGIKFQIGAAAMEKRPSQLLPNPLAVASSAASAPAMETAPIVATSKKAGIFPPKKNSAAPGPTNHPGSFGVGGKLGKNKTAPSGSSSGSLSTANSLKGKNPTEILASVEKALQKANKKKRKEEEQAPAYVVAPKGPGGINSIGQGPLVQRGESLDQAQARRITELKQSLQQAKMAQLQEEEDRLLDAQRRVVAAMRREEVETRVRDGIQEIQQNRQAAAERSEQLNEALILQGLQDEERRLRAAGDLAGLQRLFITEDRRRRRLEEERLQALRLEEMTLGKEKNWARLEALRVEWGGTAEREARLLQLMELRKKEEMEDEAEQQKLAVMEAERQSLERSQRGTEGPVRRLKVDDNSSSRSRVRRSRSRERTSRSRERRSRSRERKSRSREYSSRITHSRPEDRGREREVEREQQVLAEMERVQRQEEELLYRERAIQNRMAAMQQRQSQFEDYDDHERYLRRF